MMTKKQILQALSILNDNDEVAVVFQDKYDSKHIASTNGVSITFSNNSTKLSIVTKELTEEELSKVA